METLGRVFRSLKTLRLRAEAFVFQKSLGIQPRLYSTGRRPLGRFDSMKPYRSL